MKRMDLCDVYNMGNSLQYLRLSKFSLPDVRGENMLLSSLRSLRFRLEKVGIAKDLVKAMSEWEERLEKNYKKKNMAVSDKDANALNADCVIWRESIREELHKIPVVRIELQSGLNPDELRKVAEKEPNEFIISETWRKLTDIEKSDFSDSAKCLLMGTATPAVMVALRGAEASLRNYYRSKTQSDPSKKTWRNVTSELKKKATNLGIEDTFIGYLDYIGDAKRNFAQHPNKIYSLREAVMIFMQVVALVEDIYAQI